MNLESSLHTKMQIKIKDFSDLEVWKQGHKLVIYIYKITSTFPKSEVFGLTDQMRRCAVSITSNIAEGFSRYSFKEKLQFFRISAGSITELQNQLIIAKDVGYINISKFQALYEQTIVVLKILNGLIRNTKTKFQIQDSNFLLPTSYNSFTNHINRIGKSPWGESAPISKTSSSNKK